MVRALVEKGRHVVAVDADPLAAGLFLAREHAVVAPAIEGEAFVTDLADAAKRFHVDVIVCTVGEEMLVAQRSRERAGGRGDSGCPPHDAVVTCLDKWRFARVAGLAGVPIAPTALGDPDGEMLTPAHEIPGPWIVKPRFGRGSRDVYAVDQPAELGWACRRTPAPIVQTRVTGREFTVDLLTDRQGRLAAAVPRWRLETRAGISTKGRTFEDDRIVDVARLTLATIGLEGAANLQGFVTDDGDITVIEVNPRFSGGLALTLAAGADLVGEFVRATRGREDAAATAAVPPRRDDDASLLRDHRGRRCRDSPS